MADCRPSTRYPAAGSFLFLIQEGVLFSEDPERLREDMGEDVLLGEGKSQK